MKWKHKAHIMALLSRVPLGRRAYHQLQYWLGTNKMNADEFVNRAMDLVELIRGAGHDPCQGVFLEIGTGWRPFVPFLLSLLGAERIITLDINPWLNKAYALETYLALANQLPRIASRLDLALSTLEERYEATLPYAGTLQSLLQAFRVDYRFPLDARSINLPKNSVDYVVSSNVLEHVPPDVLQGIHRESRRILKPGGLAAHRFDPADHFSFVDQSICSVNFLRFSEKQWHWYGGSGLSYHNRLRCVQHERLVQEAGLDICTRRVRIDQRALEELRSGRVPVHPDFAGFEAEVLAGEYMWITASPRPEKMESAISLEANASV